MFHLQGLIQPSKTIRISTTTTAIAIRRTASAAVPAATAIVVVVSAATTAAGRTAEVAVERRHVLGISCICLAILFVILGIGINL